MTPLIQVLKSLAAGRMLAARPGGKRGLGERGRRELQFNRDRVSVWEDGKLCRWTVVTGYTAAGMHLMQVNCMYSENSKLTNFCCAYFITIKKKPTSRNTL